MPLVSIVIPTYNHEEFVCDAVESALNQTVSDCEVIVVDDGSTDGTAQRLQPYADRIRYIKKENGGPSSALNAGVRAANGQYFAWLSSDDLFKPAKIERQLACFAANPGTGLVYTDFEVTYIDGTFMYAFQSPHYPDRLDAARALLNQNFINGSTVMMRMDCFDQVGLFNEGYRQGQDFDMWLRVLSRFDMAHVPEVLLRYRVHWKNLSLEQEPPSTFAAIEANARKLLGL